MDRIKVTVNGEHHTVGGEVSSDTMLVDYLRQHLELRGTKFMCREGGCGACIVNAVKSPGEQPVAVNSCLVSITSCHNWDITTVEKVGNRLDGYHSIQKTLAEHNGTQCGHCTPGWIMSMYSLARSKKELTELEIEKSFGSNVCRCTGYRPILESFKKFAVNTPNNKIADIEDLFICKKSNKPCNKSLCSEDDWCFVTSDSLNQDEVIKIELKDGKRWYRVTEISQIFDILSAEGTDSYMLVVGNTAKGAFPIDEYPTTLIDISGVSELKGHSFDQNLLIGAITTISEVLDIFESVSLEREDEFGYLKKLHDHIELVGHIPVRNVGCIAGNLMTKHKHQMFPSDIFLLLETVSAYLTIVDAQGSKDIVSMLDFLKLDMKGKVIYNVMLPPMSKENQLVTFKIMPRSENAHAIVNGGFLYKLNETDNAVQDARIVFGNLSPEFIRATKTEKLLIGKELFTNDTLQSALKTLNDEIIVIEHPPDESSAYRKQLALALFYKGLLTLCPEDQMDDYYRSGVKRLHESRPVSRAEQDIGTNPNLYPLNQPIPKVEALIQCAGEAKYTEDVPSLPNEVFSALVLSTIPKGDIESIDASEAMKVPGVIAFYSAKDIPGNNSFIQLGAIAFIKEEEVFCSKKVKYYNQPLGIIVAESTAIAERAAKKVNVKYNNIEKPVIDIKEAKKDKARSKLFLPIPNIGRGLIVRKEFKSNYTIRAQIHFTMETIACVTKPSEQGLEVHSTTQWMDAVQYTTAKALNLDVNRVDVYTNRVGGAFGLKISRSTLAAVACSLAAFKLNRPCRLIQSLSSVTRSLGKRLPCTSDVEVKVDDKGLVQYMDYDLYEDNGYIVSVLVSILGIDVHHNCYKRLWWNYKCYDTITDTARNAYCRAPGSLENIAVAETIMEQISYALSLDPYDVRMTNLDIVLHGEIKEMGEELKSKANYLKRKADVDKFNTKNRWKKRGLRWAMMKYTALNSSAYEVTASIHHGDGSVTINHGGVEIGQGINTKAIQIAAYFLKIPIDKIKVKGQNTITTPNSIFTGASLTSQNIGEGVERCCKELLLRLAPVRVLLLNPSWEELIKKAYILKIDLQARSFVSHILSPTFFVYGVTLAEVELDILTGESEVLRVDLYEDVGQSVSPAIDIGQVEGAFIMGMGYWTSENVVYDQNTGEVLSDRNWNYHVPLARDIPQDFRVYFRKKSYSSPIILGSKVTGEPAACMAICVPFALRQAVCSARKDTEIPTTEWFTIVHSKSQNIIDMNRISFKVNGEDHSVGGEVSSDVMLLDYIRNYLELRGTKYMCREGGCGACIVSAATGPGETPKAINSCLVSITSCQDWEITTIEKVGNRRDGYHSIQKTIAENNGSQCGYCTPGWVMSMYSLAQNKKDLTKLDIEKSFASNICRCTGYRPILDAFKKFAVDADDNKIADIEDLYVCKKNNKPCTKTCDEEDWCLVSSINGLNLDDVIKIELKDSKKWYKVTEISQIFDILSSEGDDSYMLVAGNTAKGAYPIDAYPAVLIDITGVTELKGHEVDQNLNIRANTTLTEIMDIFEELSQEEYFEYLKTLYDHLQLVANISVRNIGTIGGNLMTKHKHRDFASDIFLLLETVDAYVTIVDSQGSRESMSIVDFLDTDMNGKILYNVMLPPLNNNYKLVTFKIMPRSQNAHAIVNSGFQYKMNNSDNTVEDARIVFGGLSPTFIRAFETEKYLIGKPLFENDTLQEAIKIMDKEIVAVEMLPEPSPEYRKKLAISLFYKGLLTLCPEDKIKESYRSGTKRLHESRPVSQGRQEFSTDPKVYPLNEPIMKVEAMIQCAGEAKYTEDLPSLPYELYSALVLSTVGRGDIMSIDPSAALAMPGVVAFYSAEDIPGENSFQTLIQNEELFCSKEIKYYNQPLGIIVAETTALAERAAVRVKVTYSNVTTPMIDIKEARKDRSKYTLFLPFPNIGRGLSNYKEFQSNYTIYGQYHFPMETVVCVSRPTEEGLAVYSTTQWMDAVQYTTARALNIDHNRVDVFTNRLGGGFGLKVSRSTLAAVACSIAAFKLNLPVRLIQSMSSATRSLGKRLPCSTDVEVTVNRGGRVQYMTYNIFEDNGHITSELIAVNTVDSRNNCYNSLWWNFTCYNAITDTAKNSYCRAPGTLEGIVTAEYIMEQISYELSLDPYDVRMTNLNTVQHSDMRTMGEELKTKAQYTERRAAVTKFNAENRWKKRGLRWAFMRYTALGASGFEVNMAICHGDGSVVINHGGIELGQGINTKAIQICAYFFNIPVDKIKVKGHTTLSAPNNLITGGSITSQSIGMGVEKCCKELLHRLAPIRIILFNPTWEQLITRANILRVDLRARTYINDLLSPVFPVYGVTLAEAEVDVLTGESEIVRVDLYEDVGRSVSPQIDVGQVEGAFSFGLGYWTSEKLVYDKDNGELKTDRSWNYYVPQARDIPQDFRIYFREKSFSAPIVLGAKVTGEPATCMSVCVPFAMREAVASARQDAGIPTTEWFTIDGPYTTEQLCLSSATKLEEFKFT